MAISDTEADCSAVILAMSLYLLQRCASGLPSMCMGACQPLGGHHLWLLQ